MIRVFGRVHINVATPRFSAGVSEVIPVQAANLDAAADLISAYCNLRQLTLCPDCTILGVTVSDSDVRGDGKAVDGFPVGGTYVVGSIPTFGVPERTARFRYDVASYLNRAIRHFHFLPADQFDSEGTLVGTGPWLALIADINTWLASNAYVATNLHSVAAPHYTFTAINVISDPMIQSSHKVGRPFGQLVGRRPIT